MAGFSIKTAILSVSDKTGLAAFAQALSAAGVTLYSTGNTAKHLSEAGVPVSDIAEVTGMEPILDGRVKTLHPHVHAGILADMSSPSHRQTLSQMAIEKIDLVVVNFYPFSEAVQQRAREEIAESSLIEQIDIGGPTMARSAAKNFNHTLIITRPADYAECLTLLQEDIDVDVSRDFARRAFEDIAALDGAIAAYFQSPSSAQSPIKDNGEDARFPEKIATVLNRESFLRYGENPHQTAALYRELSEKSTQKQIQGKELSYNNLRDYSSASALVNAIDAPAAVIVKHNIPCGVARSEDIARALEKAIAADAESAFGGVIAVNAPVTESCADIAVSSFFEMLIAPEFSEAALAILRSKPNLRVIQQQAGEAANIQWTRIYQGDFLLQTRLAASSADVTEGRLVAGESLSRQQMDDLALAWLAVASAQSNAIALVKAGVSVGIGSGQTSRLDAVKNACAKATDRGFSLDGAVAASDGFFPFADTVAYLAEQGVGAIVQPGGSRRDEEVIAEATARGIAMIFTGKRVFCH